MAAIRLLMVVTVYSVVILEVYAGVLGGPWWWVVPGILVITLVGAVFSFGEQVIAGKGPADSQSAGRWIMVLFLAVSMATFAYYFGRFLVPDIMPAHA